MAENHFLCAAIVRTQGTRPDLLREALMSVSHQSVPCLTVLVVHADNNTLLRVDRICRQQLADLSYFLLHEPNTTNKRGAPLNSGLAYCYNCGISFKGAFFLDDDDIVYPFFAQKMLQAMVATRADVIYAGSNRCKPGLPLEEGYRPQHILNLLIENFIPINSYMIRFDRLKEKRLFFDESLDVLEDWHFLLQLLKNSFHFEAISEILSEFRILSDRSSRIEVAPDIWRQTSRKIRNDINNSVFSMDGASLVSSLVSLSRHTPAADVCIRMLQDKIADFESSLSHKDAK